MLKVLVHPAGPYEVNVILVWCDRTKKAALFDPAGDSERIIAEIERNGLDLLYLINTHGHLDHIFENHLIKSRFGVPLLIHPLDRSMLTDPSKNLSLYAGEPVVSPDADGTLEDGDIVQVGDESLRALHVPGHTPGSLVFYQQGLLISGDTLFAGGVGRTDFPGSSEQVLYKQIRSKIYSLPEDTVVYPGHGTSTTIGEERRYNPFVRA
jgi:glyoxylase-like metal-dependent hydrolase (beta-lactamase superfamily II)